MTARTNIYRLAIFGLLLSRAPRGVRTVVGFMLLGVVIAAIWIVLNVVAHGKEQSRAECIREAAKTFVLADAKRMCDPRNYVHRPDEYGWECENAETGKLSRVKGRGARLKRDAICE